MIAREEAGPCTRASLTFVAQIEAPDLDCYATFIKLGQFLKYHAVVSWQILVTVPGWMLTGDPDGDLFHLILSRQKRNSSSDSDKNDTDSIGDICPSISEYQIWFSALHGY